MYEQVCYQKSFLKQVIAKVDFVTPIEQLDKTVPEKLLDAIVKYFPIVEPPQELAHHEMIIEGDSVRSNRTTSSQLNFFSKDRGRQLSLSRIALFVQYTTYRNFPEMREQFTTVVDAFSKAFPEAKAARFGLRYINQIEMQIDDPTDWQAYIAPQLLEERKFFKDEALSRLMSIAEIQYGDVNVRFQFGMPNPDYPAPIKRPMFVLDLDASISQVHELASISDDITQTHIRIQDLFERSITDTLREKMDATKSIQQ